MNGKPKTGDYFLDLWNGLSEVRTLNGVTTGDSGRSKTRTCFLWLVRIVHYIKGNRFTEWGPSVIERTTPWCLVFYPFRIGAFKTSIYKDSRLASNGNLSKWIILEPVHYSEKLGVKKSIVNLPLLLLSWIILITLLITCYFALKLYNCFRKVWSCLRLRTRFLPHPPHTHTRTMILF